MGSFTTSEFIDFINNFKTEDYFLKVSDISKPENSDRSLVYNKFRMFSFDKMCKKYNIMEDNLPKSMDAIHYETDEDDNLILYIIEFKTFNMVDERSTYTEIEALHNKFKKLNKTTCEYSIDPFISNNTLEKFEDIKEHFVDSIEFDLILKPIETLFVALPWLYDEYCNENEDVIKKDFRSYLNSIDIKLIVFINRYAPNINVSANRWSGHHIDNKLKSVYHRWYLSNVIVDDNERILSRDQFNYFIEKENLTEK